MRKRREREGKEGFAAQNRHWHHKNVKNKKICNNGGKTVNQKVINELYLIKDYDGDAQMSKSFISDI